MNNDVVFETKISAEHLEQDRQSIARFLGRYLASGAIPEVPVLNSGRIRLDGRREPIGQSSWKWSELRGKYVGCPFWSEAALETFASVAEKHDSKTPITIGRMVSAKRYNDRRIQHEHVFPRKAWREMMSEFLGHWDATQAQGLETRLDSYCVGCIVTYKEHQELGNHGSEDNPWKRYSGTSIRLVENPAWSEPHRTWIEEAGLVSR